jgi:hypothetical protein
MPVTNSKAVSDLGQQLESLQNIEFFRLKMKPHRKSRKMHRIITNFSA